MVAACAALWVAEVLWGASFPVMRHSVARLEPLDVGLFRIPLGAVVLVAGTLILAGLPLALGGRSG